MSRSDPASVLAAQPLEASLERGRVRRECTTMVLYVSLVLLATLVALPAGHEAGEATRGPVGAELIAIMWGTTVGLALLHWFAFRVATRGLGNGQLRGEDFEEATAQLAGAAFVAGAATVPVLLFPPDQEQEAVYVVLAVIVGGVGYLVERYAGRTRMTSAIFAVITLMVALIVVTVKVAITH